MITVYHALNGNLVKVATVHTCDLDTAFSLTQHHEYSWTCHGNLYAEPGKHRSTMVGDVLECDGDRYEVLSSGFKKIEACTHA